MSSAPAKRKAITKTIRFEVFKRDGFSCSYCGAHPPAAILHVDHIHPVSKGGTNEIDNLVTACEACNQGKSARLLSAVPQSLAQKAKRIKEREAQLAGYRSAVDAVRARQDDDIDAVQSVFRQRYDVVFTGPSRESIRDSFLDVLDLDVILKHARMACARIDDPNAAFKYFCGINWRVIKNDGRYAG
jgi:hypothetical protein